MMEDFWEGALVRVERREGVVVVVVEARAGVKGER